MKAKAFASLTHGDSIGHRNALRILASALPAGAAVPVPREWLLDLLGDNVTASSMEGTAPADLTAEELAQRFNRAASTVRGWIEAGRFPGAYRLCGREWRVPAAGVMAFENNERQRETSKANSPPPDGSCRLRGFLKAGME